VGIRRGGGAINDFRQFLNGLDFSVIGNLLMNIVPAIICLVFHELSHGLVALKLGDTTAKDLGRLTLNPLKHLSMMGLVMMAVFRVGYAKPVPVDMRRFNNPRLGMAITAFAGPFSNIVLAAAVLFLAGFLIVPLSGAGQFGQVMFDLLLRVAMMSCFLAVFNIIPIPPLDGSKVVFAVLPDKWYYKLMQYERFGFFILILVVYLNVLSSFLTSSANWLLQQFSVFMRLSMGISSLF
jgi:Zn-dependent protease